MINRPSDARNQLTQIWTAAIGAVDPLSAVPPHLPPPPEGRLVIIGAGKASARMALAAERHYGGPLEGLILTRYGHGEAAAALKIIEAGHPVPDAAGRAGAQEILTLAESLGENDLLLVMLSGGGSALLALPAPGLTLEDKQAATRALLASGGAIDEINTVRKHLSRLKGGRLAAAAFPARVVTLAVSDVPGDDPSVIASGPTMGDPTTLADARRVIAAHCVTVPNSVSRALNDPHNESIKPGDARLAKTDYRLIARPRDALDAAARAAGAFGYRVIDLGDRVEGEARLVGAAHARMALDVCVGGEPVAILSGGELTVTGATGEHSGGRAREYALALGLAAGFDARIACLAADTDGIDGSADAAGAFVLPGTVDAHAQAAARSALDAHRSGVFFARLNAQLVTGPTRTNVGDLRVVLLHP